MEIKNHNNRMQPDFGELRSPQPLMPGVEAVEKPSICL
jgi:hypothetical protein